MMPSRQGRKRAPTCARSPAVLPPSPREETAPRPSPRPAPGRGAIEGGCARCASTDLRPGRSGSGRAAPGFRSAPRPGRGGFRLGGADQRAGMRHTTASVCDALAGFGPPSSEATSLKVSPRCKRCRMCCRLWRARDLDDAALDQKEAGAWIAFVEDQFARCIVPARRAAASAPRLPGKVPPNRALRPTGR